MTPKIERQTVADMDAFVRELMDPARTIPVVAVTTARQTRKPRVDLERLAAGVQTRARLVLIETGEATWALSARLPPRLDVFDGAVRVWLPGLEPTSDPHSHPLLFIFDSKAANKAVARICELVGVMADPPEVEPLGTRPERPFKAASSERDRPERTTPRPRNPAPPSAWQVVGVHYKIGDVVRARVASIQSADIAVTLLPGADILVRGSEIPRRPGTRLDEALRVGQRVAVKLLELDPALRRGVGSLRQADNQGVAPPLRSSPDAPAFLDDEPAKPSKAHVPVPVRQPAPRSDELRRVEQELRAALDDRAALIERNRTLQEQLAKFRKLAHGHRDRLRELESSSGESLALQDPNRFLEAVRVAYARQATEADRFVYPLARMRVGSEFLESARRLTDVPQSKLVEVCAQVACGRAHLIPGRKAKRLREGDGGAPDRVREDGAKAQRCSLQTNSSSARRLHWWDIPGPEGRVIEFASVDIHDVFDIPD